MDTSSDFENELFPVVTSNVCLYEDPCVLIAVVEENLDRVKQLIESGKDVNINDNDGTTPLHIAVIKNNLEILEYLLTRNDVVVNVRNFKGKTPLYYAVRMGRLQLAAKLVQAGANVNLPTYKDVTPLHVSVPYPEVAHLLILHGAEIDAVDFNGDTPLHRAIVERKLDTVCMLLYYNADANALGGYNLTPFMKALIAEDIQIQEALIDYVDDFNAATKDHFTTLELALEHDTVYLEEIIKRGADVNNMVSYDDMMYETMRHPFLLCLKAPSCKKFKLIWEKLRYDGTTDRTTENPINLLLFFEYLKISDVEKYIQIVIESGNLQPVVESFTEYYSYSMLIRRFALHKLKLQQLTELTCCLLQFGYRATVGDIHGIFYNYGYCELFKILLFMDNDYSNDLMPNMLVPTFMFYLDLDLMSRIFEIRCYHMYNALEFVDFMEYFYYPPLVGAWMLGGKAHIRQILKNIGRVPLLTELARNVTRVHIIKSFNVSSICQFYTIINHLKIAPVLKKILTFEQKLYDLSHAKTFK